jgi:hypothetical protein
MVVNFGIITSRPVLSVNLAGEFQTPNIILIQINFKVLLQNNYLLY